MDNEQKRKYIKRYYRRCLQLNGVQNAIVFNTIGIPHQSTFNRRETVHMIGLIDEILLKVKRVIEIIKPDDTFVSLRLRTHKFEMFITLDLDDLYFVVFQNAKDKDVCKISIQ